jgi:hypothetical protein
VITFCSNCKAVSFEISCPKENQPVQRKKGGWRSERNERKKAAEAALSARIGVRIWLSERMRIFVDMLRMDVSALRTSSRMPKALEIFIVDRKAQNDVQMVNGVKCRLARPAHD